MKQLGNAVVALLIGAGVSIGPRAARAGEPSPPPPVPGAAPVGGCAAPAPLRAELGGDCLPAPPPSALATALSTMKTPESPALSVIGLGTSVVQSPGTPTGVAVSTQASSTGSGGLSVDFTPYWLLAHPRLSHEEIEKHPGEALWRDASVSLAAAPSKATVPAAAGGTTTADVEILGGGLRLTLLPGSPTSAALFCDDLLTRDSAAANAAATTQANAALDAWEAAHPRPPKRPELDSWNAAANKELDAWAKSLPTLAAKVPPKIPLSDVRECLDVVHQREGLMATGAAALAYALPWNDPHPSAPGGARVRALWLTLGYVSRRDVTHAMLVAKNAREIPTAADLSVLVAVRKTWSEVSGMPEARPLDVGVRTVVAASRYGVSLEAICRCSSTDAAKRRASYTSTVVFDYHLKSGAWATLAGGRINDDLGTGTTYKIIGGLQVNFGTERLLAPDTALTYASAPTQTGPSP